MPGGDRTGPRGAGPITGRGLGFCAGYDVPGYLQGGVGRPGWRGFYPRGGGGGYGYRHWYYATGLPRWGRYVEPWWSWSNAPAPTAQERAEMLKAQAQALRDELNAIEEDLASLERSQTEEQGK